ncbi:hypothetical protein M422DRAFT_274912 [Sphaerobolus stellatus SS14]|uniref:CHAT domain-containing protein n=1 Tax=Sphaerobolus stellatus (strain SS14) TaxID=990650 RepID=A0A0C9UFV9_SPHS4|nr:hypothetical protein M422DRAFT_274912 [Sphaerobolus stellatus SS14]
MESSNNSPQKETNLPDVQGYEDQSGLARHFLMLYVSEFNLDHLNTAILMYQRLSTLSSLQDGHKFEILNNLGTALQMQYRHAGNIVDINNAILLQRALREALALVSVRFERLGNFQDLDETILLQQQLVDLLPDDHEDKHVYVNSLSLSLRQRFVHSGNRADIDKAITAHQQAVALIPPGCVGRLKPGFLRNLGMTLHLKFEHLGDLVDLDATIEINQQALNLAPMGHPERADCLSSLGNSLRSKFQRLGNLMDIDKSIDIQHEALSLIPNGSDQKPIHLNNLGNCIQSRFKCTGNFADLDEAITLQQEAVDLIPEGHIKRPTYLSNLGLSLQGRYSYLGNLDDLNTAISLHQQAVDLTLDGDPDKPGRLNNLGSVFQLWFEHDNNLEDINKAIVIQQRATSLSSDEDADKYSYLLNLGISFGSRLSTLEAVTLTPDGYTDKPCYFNHLGNLFLAQFEHIGDPGDIDRAIHIQEQDLSSWGNLNDIDIAISLQEKAIMMTPDGHANKYKFLNNLGNSLQCHFEHHGNVVDINRAIMKKQEAVRLVPPTHPSKPGTLSSLGSSLQKESVQLDPDIHFGHLGNLADLDQVILNHQKAINLTPNNHVYKPSRLHNLGCSYRLCFEHSHIETDIGSAIVIQQQAVSLTPDDHSAKPIYLLQLGNTFGTHFKHLEKLEDIESAISIQQQAMDLTPDSHANTPRTWHCTCTMWIGTGTDSSSCMDWSKYNSKFNEILKIGQEYEQCVQEIQKLDGFKDFLRPKRFPDLIAATRNGPVVAINVMGKNCDALIFHSFNSNNPVIHVALSKLSSSDIKLLSSKMNMILKKQSKVRKIQFVTNEGDSSDSTMQIEDLLKKNRDENLPHITWCTTGLLAFLPLHAAGNYNSNDPSKKSTKVLDFIVSSYTPTLAALLRQPPNAPNYPKLPGMLKEASTILKSNLPTHLTHFTDKQGTTSSVLDAMKEHNWVHLACHGIQDIAAPLQSAFALHDGKLTPEDLMRTSLKHSELAFLSACETATGDEK